jgi:hypothetical protein
MNYLPYCGWFFFGGTTTAETAAYVCSWGLLRVAGSVGGLVIAPLVMFYRRMLKG